MSLITCPCCKGENIINGVAYLLVYSEAEPIYPPAKMTCCHCVGGFIRDDNLKVEPTKENKPC